MQSGPTLAILIVGLTFLPGCGEGTTPAQAAVVPSPVPAPTTVDSPAATVRKMLELAEAGDWGTYVDDFYGEQHKFQPGQANRDQLVQMLTKRSAQIIDGLRQIVDIDSRLSEDGNQAIFELGEGQTFILHRADDGRWTFHL